MSTESPEYAHLRALAEAATPGPWEVPESIHGDPYINEVGKGVLSGGSIALATARDDYGRSNAAYIAAANPAVMLVLLDRLAAVEQLADEIDRHDYTPECMDDRCRECLTAEAIRAAALDVCYSPGASS